MQRLLVHTFVWIIALFVVGQLLFSATHEPAQKEQEQALALSASRTPSQSGFSEEGTVIERDASGQFHLQAQVNGEDTQFLVDTGADIVALTVAEAERLGLDVPPDDFQPIMQTASGVGYAAKVELDRLGLGNEEFHGVDAVVVEGLSVNLLGQSVLRRLGKVELQGDRMVIHHQ
jgi:aspartyl protease family protein